MDPDDITVSVSGWIGEANPQVPESRRLHQSGHSTLCDSQVLTLEVMGGYLGL